MYDDDVVKSYENSIGLITIVVDELKKLDTTMLADANEKYKKARGMRLPDRHLSDADYTIIRGVEMIESAAYNLHDTVFKLKEACDGKRGIQV